MRNFDDLFALDHNVIILVPSTVNVNETNPEIAASVLQHISHELANTYGGATVLSSGKGFWPSQQMGMVEESVVPVQCFITELSATVQDHVIGLCEYIKDVMSQESVFLIVDGKGKLV